jgi:hypothetical protein
MPKQLHLLENFMKNLTKFLLAAGASTLLCSGAYAYNITATVSNTITLAQTTPFTIGSVFVRQGVDIDATVGSTPANIIINPTTSAATATAADADADVGDSISKFVSLGGAQAGVLSVTGAQPFGAVTVTSGSPTNLIHSSGNPALPVIIFSTVTTSPATAGTLTLDGTGAGQILVGGTFTAAEATTLGAVASYQDGTYTGTYAVTVSY